METRAHPTEPTTAGAGLDGNDRSTTSGSRATRRTVGAVLAAGALAFGGGYAAQTIGSAAASPAPAMPLVQQATAAQATEFVPISHYRAYDSRIDPDESGQIGIQEQRFVDAATDLDGVERIPDEATAVSFNLTIADTIGRGYVQVSPPGTSFDDTSTVNWTADGEVDANSGNVLMYTGATFENNIVFHVNGRSGGTHVIIDITGYYIPAS